MTDQQALTPVQTGVHDDKLISMWLQSKNSEHTRRGYARIVNDFVAYVGKPLELVRLDDLQAYVNTLQGTPGTIALSINALKSLFTFGTELNYFQVNVGKALKSPKVPSELAQRILTQEQAKAMVNGETNRRNHAILRLLYSSGLRVVRL